MKLTKENIMNEVDLDKVSLAFGLFVIGKQSEEHIHGYLHEFREMFLDTLRNKAVQSQPDTNGDEEWDYHNDIEVDREVETTGIRSMLDLEKQMMDLQTDKESWKKIFSERLQWT